MVKTVDAESGEVVVARGWAWRRRMRLVRVQTFSYKMDKDRSLM